MGKKGAEKIREWVKMYQYNGSLAFNDGLGYRKYTEEFKIEVVNDYISSGLSQLDITAKYNLSSCTVLREWVSKYNNGERLKSIIDNPEVYHMPRLKATREEKLNIVQFCLKHNNNYALTAQEFGVSYHQVYEWCKKYRLDDELETENTNVPKEEHLKNDNHTNKNENHLKNKIKILEHKNTQLEREIEVLKKAYALEMELLQLQGIKKKQ